MPKKSYFPKWQQGLLAWWCVLHKWLPPLQPACPTATQPSLGVNPAISSSRFLVFPFLTLEFFALGNYPRWLKVLDAQLPCTIVLCRHQQSSMVNLELSFFPKIPSARVLACPFELWAVHAPFGNKSKRPQPTRAETEGLRKSGLEKWLSGRSICRASKDLSSSPPNHSSRGWESAT